MHPTKCRQQSSGLATTSAPHTPSRFVPNQGLACSMQRLRRKSRRLEFVVNTYPEPETEKERSPLDYPQASGLAAAFDAVGEVITVDTAAAFFIHG